MKLSGRTKSKKKEKKAMENFIKELQPISPINNQENIPPHIKIQQLHQKVQ